MYLERAHSNYIVVLVKRCYLIEYSNLLTTPQPTYEQRPLTIQLPHPPHETPVKITDKVHERQ